MRMRARAHTHARIRTVLCFCSARRTFTGSVRAIRSERVDGLESLVLALFVCGADKGYAVDMNLISMPAMRTAR